MIMKFIWLRGFHTLAREIFMIGQTAPCWDEITRIIWVPHLLQKLFEIVSLILISTLQDLPLHYYSLLEIGIWVTNSHIYLICIIVFYGIGLTLIQRSLKRGTIGISHLNEATFQLEATLTKWILNCIFPSYGVEYWHQERLWWLGNIHRIRIYVFSLQLAEIMAKWQLPALTSLQQLNAKSTIEHLCWHLWFR